MKSLIAAAFLISTFSAFGANGGAVESFLSVLPLGTHSGQNDLGAECKVIVQEVNFPEIALSITAINNNQRVFKVIRDDSDFLLRAYRSEFIQSERYDVNANRNSYVERIVRTLTAGSNKLYVVVAHEVTVNRELKTDAVECVVDL